MRCIKTNDWTPQGKISSVCVVQRSNGCVHIYKGIHMKFILRFFHRLERAAERRERERQEAYLAKSTDVYNLEYRMRELEQVRKAFPYLP